jgi:hypothetical protein
MRGNPLPIGEASIAENAGQAKFDCCEQGLGFSKAEDGLQNG